MHLVLIIAGGFLGLLLAEADRGFFGLLFGGAIGYLAYRNWQLRSELQQVTKDVEWRFKSFAALTEGLTSTGSFRPKPAAAKAPQPEETASPPPPRTIPTARKRPEPAPEEAVREDSPTEPGIVSAKTSEPNAFDRGLEAAKAWITTGNVPVKVGLIVLFFGVAFLLKYAIDQQLFNMPIELRLLAVAAGGVALLVFGWRLREKKRNYALNLQGGGIGVLYLTIFAAFRFWMLLPVYVAFGLLIALTILGCFLAVVQNSRALATTASVGGFLAPVLVSTGSGNHVALFSYYLVLNCAILAISWHRAWRALNLIGFVFTFGVGTIWGFQYYRPELYASTQPFLIANFLFYQAIAILFAFRQPPELRGLVDGTIVFGTPVIAFSLQAQLVADTEYGLAISAGAAALFYAGVAWWLYQAHEDRMRLLRQSFTVLGVGFATIAAPLALDDRWSAIAWALEGAGVVWVGVRQKGTLARVTGTALIFASGYFFLEHGWRVDIGWPILNGNFLGGAIIATAAMLASRWLRDDKNKLPLQNFASVSLLLWSVLWWLGTGIAEIYDRIVTHEGDVMLMFLAASACGLAWLARHDSWRAARRTSYAAFPVFALLALLYAGEADHFFRDWGWLSWPAIIASTLFIVRAAESSDSRILPGLNAAILIGVATLLGYEVAWRMHDAGFSDVWIGSAVLATEFVLVSALLYLRERVEWPFARYPASVLLSASIVLGAQLVLLLVLSVNTSGDPHPWPYIPILNPLDALMLASFVIAGWCGLWWRGRIPDNILNQLHLVFVLLGGVAFTLSTLAVVRIVHHYWDVPWDGFALRRSVSVQAALSIYWALLGVAGMVIGTKRMHYWIWLAGVGLMGVVVLKLFFVDLGNTGTVARIVSFIGVGALLLVVGYFAPRPPRPWNAETAETQNAPP